MGTPSEPAEPSDLALAARLEALRRERGLSLDTAAELTGLSRATISRIERGETSPTANALGRLCGAYGLTMSRLMAGVEENAPRLLRGSEAARWTDPETGYVRTLVAPPSHEYATELALGELPAGVEIHYDGRQAPGREQFFYLLEGALSLDLGGETYLLAPSDSLRHRGLDATRIGNPGAVTARYLIINTTTT